MPASTFATTRRATTLAYLAGLLDGEGSFLCPPPSMPNQPAVALAMTDEDIVARAALLLEAKYMTLPRRQSHHKVVYVVRVRGHRAVETMEALEPHMGLRRRQQIDAALKLRTGGPKRIPYSTELAEMVRLRRNGAHRVWLAERYGIRPQSVSNQLRGDPGGRSLDAALALASQVEVAENELEVAASGDPDLAWLAGLLEGEGHFLRGGVRVRMTDRDVVERAGTMMGTRPRVERARRPNWAPVWEAAAVNAAGRELARRLWPLLGQRRQRQVDAMAGAVVASPTGVRTIPAERAARNREIARRILDGETGPALAAEYAMTHQNVYYIAKTYRHLVECPRG